MGYSIKQGKTTFRIPKSKMDEALGLLKAYATDLGAGQAHVHYKRSFKSVLTEPHFKGALEEFGWDSTFDVNGDCTKIFYEAEKSDNEEEVLRRLAPVVDDGSSIEFRGEDGCKWRYTFLHGKLSRQDAILTWGNPVEVKP
jgi:hypothetical protein